MTDYQGFKTSIRISRLTVNRSGKQHLAGAEAHAKRQDESSQKRQINNLPPLVYGGLDLADLYTKHVAGCKMDKRTKSPVMHLLFQFPTAVLVTEANQQEMLDTAVTFANDLLGGRAVFAARLDRDERNQHVVDVFASPITTKHHKNGNVEDWVQTSKHLKELTKQHREEILRRHPKIKPQSMDSMRCQGIALQSEWINHLRELGYDIDDKKPKRHLRTDWQTPEEYALNERERVLKRRLERLKDWHAELQVYALQNGLELPPDLDEPPNEPPAWDDYRP